MNGFEERVAQTDRDGLVSSCIETVQVNVGLRCNMSCAHCHVESSPRRTEVMEWPTMEAIITVLPGLGCKLVDLTGGAPELNPSFRRFVQAIRACDVDVQVRTNLTVMLEPGMENIPGFLKDNRVRLVASLPCYLEENVRAQRGPGIYEKSVEVIKRLNEIGYGVEPELPLNLVYNPGGPTLPPDQAALEADYKRELANRFGIQFTHLLTITNAPIGRFRSDLAAHGRDGEYLRMLKDAFNPETVSGLMCRNQISIGWDGTLYDCDFNLALGFPIDHGAPNHIRDFDAEALKHRRIVTGNHCFSCTAGAGSSCSGALR